MIAATKPESADSSSAEKKPRSRPLFELGQILRLYGDDYRKVHLRHLTVAQQRTLRELAACRTGALGGHVNECHLGCGHKSQAYNSCDNRMCPTCRAQHRARWYLRQARRMLPVEYLHVVFTVTDEIARLARYHPEIIYELCFYAASRALKEVGRDWLGVELGIVIVLHTWGQLLNLHPHGHCLLPAGGISLDDGRWISLPPGGTLPLAMLRKAFPKFFMKRLKRLYRDGSLVLEGELAYLADPKEFEKWYKALSEQRWIVHVTQATADGECRGADHQERFLRYMARYVSGMVFSNHRLISISGGRITFSYKDYRTGGRIKQATLPAVEFIDRLLQHVLPAGLRQKRYYGFLATWQQRTKLQEIRQMLGADDPEAAGEEADGLLGGSDSQGDDLGPGYTCPVCKQGRMVRGPELPRPTVPQIMTMPFPNDAYVQKQKKRLKAMGRRRRTRETTSWPAVVPSGELEQRLLAFEFT